MLRDIISGGCKFYFKINWRGWNVIRFKQESKGSGEGFLISCEKLHYLLCDIASAFSNNI